MEIERKFLTKEIPFSLEGYKYADMRQSYISYYPTIRIRKSNESYYLTVKGKGHIAREEFEIPISEVQYETLLLKKEGNEVRKRRYYIPIAGGYTAEFDVYEGELAGLLTTEVEFESEEASEKFVPPTWFGVDISDRKEYKNTALAEHGLPKE